MKLDNMKLILPAAPGQNLIINDTSAPARNYATFENNSFIGVPRPPCSISPPCQHPPLPPRGMLPMFQPPPRQMNGDFREGFYNYTPCGMYIQENNFCPYVPYSVQGPAMPVAHYPVQGIHHIHHQVDGMHSHQVQVMRAHPLQPMPVPCRTQARYPLVPMQQGTHIVKITKQCEHSSMTNANLRKSPSPIGSPVFNKEASPQRMKDANANTNKTKQDQVDSRRSNHEDRLFAPVNIKVVADIKKHKLFEPIPIVEIKKHKLFEPIQLVEVEKSELLGVIQIATAVKHEKCLFKPILILEIEDQEKSVMLVDKYGKRLEEFPTLPIDIHDILHFIDENIEINGHFEAEIGLLDDLSCLVTSQVHLIVTKSDLISDSPSWIQAFLKSKSTSENQDRTTLKYSTAVNRFLIVREICRNSVYLESVEKKDDIIVKFRTYEECQRFQYVLQMYQAEINIMKPKTCLSTDNLSVHSEVSSEVSEELNTSSGYGSS